MSPEIEKAIRENYLTKNDREIGDMFGLSPRTIRGHRFSLRLNSRFLREEEKDRNIIANIIELFVAEIPMQNIARLYQKSNSTISQLITKHYFSKQRSYDTITMVMDSKINYD